MTIFYSGCVHAHLRFILKLNFDPRKVSSFWPLFRFYLQFIDFFKFARFHLIWCYLAGNSEITSTYHRTVWTYCGNKMNDMIIDQCTSIFLFTIISDWADCIQCDERKRLQFHFLVQRCNAPILIIKKLLQFNWIEMLNSLYRKIFTIEWKISFK